MREKYLNLSIDQPSWVPVTVQGLLHFWVLNLPDITNWKQMWTMGSQSAVCACLVCPAWGVKVAQFLQDTQLPWWCSIHTLYSRWYCFSDLSFRHGFCSSITSDQYNDLNNQINLTQPTCWNLTRGPFFYSHAYSSPYHLAALTARGPHSLITALPSSSCTATCVFPVDRLCSEATSHTHYIPSKWKPAIALSSTATIYYQRPKNSHHKDALPQTPLKLN